MRPDDDFASYAGARWPSFVRMLSLLGLPQDAAEEVTTAALARLLPEWPRLRREGDPDLELSRRVLDGWVRVRGREPARTQVPLPAGRLLTPELEDQLALFEDLGAGLERLDETTRLAVVLRHVVELDRDQVGQLLGEGGPEVTRQLADASSALRLGMLDEACRRAASAVDPGVVPLGEITARAAASRRRVWMITLGVVAVVVLGGVLSFAVTRPPTPDRLEALDVSPVENPLGLSWWVDGVLHLEHGTADLPGVRALVDTGVGVVYADARGRLVAVTDDGARERIGTREPGTPLVSSVRLGVVAWVEPGGDLVVYDVITQREAERIPGTPDLRLVGWDRERLYFHSDGAERVLTITPSGVPSTSTLDKPESGPGSQLVDVAAGAEMRLRDGVLTIEQPFFSISRQVPGLTGQLSPDGNFVLTRVGEGPPAAYDARSGVPQGTWFQEGWTPVAAAFTPVGRAVWIVADAQGELALYECQVAKRYINSFDPDAEPCTPRTDLGDHLPVLAGTEPGLGRSGPG